MDGVYRRTDGEPVFVEVPVQSDQDLQALLHKIITWLTKLLTRRGVHVEEEAAGGSSYLADAEADAASEGLTRAHAPRSLQGPRVGQDVDLPDQQHPAASVEHRRTVQESLGR